MLQHKDPSNPKADKEKQSTKEKMVTNIRNKRLLNSPDQAHGLPESNRRQEGQPEKSEDQIFLSYHLLREMQTLPPQHTTNKALDLL